MLKEHLKLPFDPFDEEVNAECPGMKEVFSDPIARTLWLGIRQHHLICQYFEKNCLRAANTFRDYLDKKKPINPIMIHLVLGGNSESEILPADKELCDYLLPFLKGEKEFTFEICPEETSEPMPHELTNYPKVNLPEKKACLPEHCTKSLAIMKGIKEAKRGKVVKILQLTGYVIKLKDSGIEIGAIAISQSSKGLWSEGIAKFVTNLESQNKLRQFRDEHIQFKDPNLYEECLGSLMEYGHQNQSTKQLINRAMKVLNLGIFS